MVRDIITVDESGLIIGIGRYTEIPFEAYILAERNMIYPEEAKSMEFEAKRSDEVET